VKKWDWLRANGNSAWSCSTVARCLSQFFHSLVACWAIELDSRSLKAQPTHAPNKHNTTARMPEPRVSRLTQHVRESGVEALQRSVGLFSFDDHVDANFAGVDQPDIDAVAGGLLTSEGLEDGYSYACVTS